MIDNQQPEVLPAAFKHTGTVVHGEKVGRQLGYPTANLAQIPEADALKPGVYFGQCQIVELDGTNTLGHDCLVYFGPRYIFGEHTNAFEAYLYDFDGDLYGKTIHSNLTHFLRPPVKMTGLEELKQHLNRDKEVGSLLRSTHITS